VIAQARTKEAVRRARDEAYRELILEAAQRVFAERGYAEAKVQGIAEAAGVATGTVYAIFPGKKDLYLAVHRVNLEQLSAQYAEMRTEGLGSGQILLERIAVSTRFLTARPDYLRIYLREARTWGLDPTGFPREATAFMDLDLYRRGTAAGELVDENPEVLQGMGVALTQVLLHRWLQDGEKESPDALTQRIQAFHERAFFRAGARDAGGRSPKSSGRRAR
jgi:AcrR family transcriptional regulator